ncbi:hypothetical protein D3C87_1732570 [compost metagenome]
MLGNVLCNIRNPAPGFSFYLNLGSPYFYYCKLCCNKKTIKGYQKKGKKYFKCFHLRLISKLLVVKLYAFLYHFMGITHTQ